MANIQTYKDLQDRVLRLLDEAGDTDTTLDLVKDALNEANRERATQEKWPFMLWDSAETFSTEAGLREYSLVSEFHRPFYFYNRTTGDYLTQLDEGNLLQAAPDWINDTGSAEEFNLWGRMEVLHQPTSQVALTVTSSNTAADNGSKSVVVRGMKDGVLVSEEIVCGSTSTNAFSKILKLTKKGTWTGTMSLTDPDARVLQTLFPTEYGRSSQQFQLAIPPDAVEQIEYRFYRQPLVMTEDNDRPDIPTPFEDLLVYDALVFFATYNEYDAATVKLWMMKRDRLETRLGQAYEDRAINALSDYVDYIPR